MSLVGQKKDFLFHIVANHQTCLLVILTSRSKAARASRRTTVLLRRRHFILYLAFDRCLIQFIATLVYKDKDKDKDNDIYNGDVVF